MMGHKKERKTALLGNSCQLMVKDVITDDDTAMVSKQGNRKTVLLLDEM